MTYAIDLSILDGQTAIEDLKTWRTFEDEKRGVRFNVLIGYMTPDAQEAWAKSLNGRDAGPDDFGAWKARALDWSDIVGADGAQVPFTSARLDRLWEVDPGFRLWLIREAQRFDNFRCQSVTAPAA